MNRHQRRRTSKNASRTANKLLRQLEGDVSGYKGRCLFVTGDNGEFCNKPVSNNCHIVSKTAVLDGLKDDKTKRVLELQWGVGKWREMLFSGEVVQRVKDPSAFEPSVKTTGAACVGRFACKQSAHDNEFQPIDVAEPDFDDPVVRFLSAYRLLLFVSDQCRLAMYLYQIRDQLVVSIYGRAVPAMWLSEKEKLNKALQEAEAAVVFLGRNWHARKNGGIFDLEVVSAQVLNFRSKLRIAGGMFYGNATGVTVFPVQGHLHKMALLYLTSESGPAGQDVERIAAVARVSEVSDDYGVKVTDELFTNGWGSLAVSPGSYKALNEQDRLTMQRLVAEHARI